MLAALVVVTCPGELFSDLRRQLQNLQNLTKSSGNSISDELLVERSIFLTNLQVEVLGSECDDTRLVTTNGNITHFVRTVRHRRVDIDETRYVWDLFVTNELNECVMLESIGGDTDLYMQIELRRRFKFGRYTDPHGTEWITRRASN